MLRRVKKQHLHMLSLKYMKDGIEHITFLAVEATSRLEWQSKHTTMMFVFWEKERINSRGC